jgi:hypothetical protein
MPKIDTKLAERLPAFKEGLIGTIISADIVKTQQRGFDGVRCIIKGDDGNEYAEMLWVKNPVGPTSKLGTFIANLGDDTDKWIGKKIKIVRWVSKDREIRVIEEEGKRKAK